MKKVSFVIPAYNEDRYIHEVLYSITSQIEKRKIESEIIVVDNGSTDKTVEKAKKFNVTVNSIEKSTVSSARNTGVRLSTGTLIAFIDGDTVLTDSWFDRLEVLLEEKDLELSFCTGSSVVIPDDPSWIEWAWFDQHSKNYIGGANIICTKKCFTQVNGFNENLETGEDYDFCMRIKNEKIPFKIDNEFKAIHLGYPKNIKEFLKREIWHGKGDCYNFNFFIKSKVAIMGVCYLGILLLSIIGFLTLNIKISILSILTLLLVNLIITYLRFKKSPIKKMPYKFLLNFVYFLGRGISPIKVAMEK